MLGLQVLAVLHKRTYSTYVLCLLLVIAVQHGTVQSAPTCTEEQTNQMQKEFTVCKGEATSKHQASLQTENPETATCTLFQTIQEECAKILEQCQTPQDVSKMKNMQMENLLAQYTNSGAVTLEECDIVKQYWESEAVQEEGSGEYCTDKQFTRTQTKFQKCSHELSTKVYQSFQEMTGEDSVKEAICLGLTKIQDTCPTLLKSCFREGEISQMVYEHLKQIRKYLTSISSIPVTEESIDTCFKLVEVEYTYPEYDYSEEDYGTEENKTPDIETRSNEIKEILSEHKAEAPADQPIQEIEETAEDEPETEDTPEKAEVKEKEKREEKDETKEVPKMASSKPVPKTQSSVQTLRSSSANSYLHPSLVIFFFLQSALQF